MSRHIAVLTTSRADFSHLRWPLQRIIEHPGLNAELIVSGAHLSSEFGYSIDEIRAAGFTVDHVNENLLSSDSDVGMAKTIGLATLGLADLFSQIRPDVLLLIADRYELLAPAAAALALRIPIAHIEGGEISTGAIDDAVRNAITKMAHLHFTPTGVARQRVIAMGEEAWRVHATGAPSLDTLRNQVLLTRDQLEGQLGCRLEEALSLVALHPVTLLEDTLAEAPAVFSALEQLDRQLLFCFPNADAGSRQLITQARDFCAKRDNAQVFVNLAPHIYWSLLAQSELLVGNSSSGIMEAPALKIPVVNIGIRQQGRLRAANVIDTPADTAAILAAVARADSEAFRAGLAQMENPYGDGCAGERIAQILADAPPRDKLLGKRALPLKTSAEGGYFFSSGTTPANDAG
ncbi:MAG: UDP-N-acetylglucosamine 2-epimerase (hydrolyzing) [Gammaproteobacteria bacterium]|nr:UDP-N-acetylglucosamine 2-epimerase (hydrolyzing) [Gammaproteobacteria bacterium]